MKKRYRGPNRRLLGVIDSLSLKKRKIAVEIISSLFILLFLYTALSKSFQIQNTINVLKKTPFFTSFPEVTAWSIVVIEYIIAALLFLPQTWKVGMVSSFVLMVGFTLYIGYMKAFISNLPCSCGGVISKMTWNQHLIFNIFFTVLALLGILLGIRSSRPEEPNTDPSTVVFT
jgi:hypothetical protein